MSANVKESIERRLASVHTDFQSLALFFKYIPPHDVVSLLGQAILKAKNRGQRLDVWRLQQLRDDVLDAVRGSHES